MAWNLHRADRFTWWPKIDLFVDGRVARLTWLRFPPDGF